MSGEYYYICKQCVIKLGLTEFMNHHCDSAKDGFGCDLCRKSSEEQYTYKKEKCFEAMLKIFVADK